AYCEPLKFEIPVLERPHESWRGCIDTYLDPPDDICGLASARSLQGSTCRVEPRSLDSSSENRRQKEFNNCRAKVRRQGDRRSVEWLCRRDGRRLRACWPACDGCQGSGESGCWRAGRRAVCERTGRAGRPEPLLG